VLECGFCLFFFPFVTLYCASPKALHDQQYQLETLRDWFFVNKKYYTKGPTWSAIPIRNTKRLNICEQNLQETDQFKIFWRSGNFSEGCCLVKSKHQSSVNFIQTYTVHILLNYHIGIGANHFDRDTTICLYIKVENEFLQLLPCPTWAAMDCVFHV
jgi:hypothetical protein